MEEQVFSVTGLSNAIKSALEDTLGKVWVEGEISNYKPAGSGHIYFTLKDENSQIKIAYFRHSQAGLSIQDGQKVMVYGKVTAYTRRSEYQVIADKIKQTGTGDLLLKLEELKKKLSAEGLFDEARKKEICAFPAKIAVITSRTGAAIRDIINIITKRYTLAEVLVYPVPVQGADAPPLIIQAIQDINEMEGIDTLILARGGGSIEDLWAFNDEGVARAIYASQVPVITGIGHEVDWTIADFVSDLRAPTPSGAAMAAVPDQSELLSTLDSSAERIENALDSRMQSLEQRLEELAKRRGLTKPFARFDEYEQNIDELSASLDRATDKMLEAFSEKAGMYEKTLSLLNPLNILKKGYAVAYDADGRAIKDASKLKAGAEVNVKVHKGAFDAKVTKTK